MPAGDRKFWPTPFAETWHLTAIRRAVTPRFSADNYFKLYLADRAFSYKFAYIMSKVVSVMDSIEHAELMLATAATETDESLTQTQKELGAAFNGFGEARDGMGRGPATSDWRKQP